MSASIDTPTGDAKGLPAHSLSGTDKAAVVLLSLGPTLGAQVLKSIPEDQVELLTARMARMESVAPSQVEAVLEDFHTDFETRDIPLGGNLEHVRTILTEAFGREHATKLVDRLAKAMSEQENELGNLRKVEPQQLAKFIQDEHPQLIALVVAHLDPSHAAGLLSALPVEIRLSVIKRVAALGRISPESVRTVANVIRQKLRNLGELSREVSGGVRAVADVFNRLDAATCAEMLDALERDDPTLFDGVRRFMFVFEDLLSVDEASMRVLVQNVERQMLVTALKGASEDLKRHVFSVMAARAAEMMRDDLANTGPVKLKAVDNAQQGVIAIARQLERQGTISLKSSPADAYLA